MTYRPQQKIYVLAETGALGDTVTTFPILKILAQRGHIEKMFVDDYYMGLYKLVFDLIDPSILVRLHDAVTIIPKDKVTPDIPQSVIDPNTGEAKFLSYPLIPGIPVVHTQNQSGLTSIHAHLIDGFSSVIANCILKEHEKDYPRISQSCLPPMPAAYLVGENKVTTDRYATGGDGLPQLMPYVAISYGATAPNRRMLPEVFAGIKKWCFDHGHNVVLLGSRDHVLNIDVAGGKKGETTVPNFKGMDTSGCIDLIDKTTIPEALSVMACDLCRLCIGMDGGLMHLAAMGDNPIVIGYTTVDPYYRIPYRNGIKGYDVYPVEPDEECRYCQTNTFCTYGTRFDRCPIGTNECMYSLTLDKWIGQIEKALTPCVNIDGIGKFKARLEEITEF